jgi:hypothetical protein
MTASPQKKVTLAETSNHGPSLTTFKNAFVIGWGGTDNNFLNVEPSNVGGTAWGPKTTIDTETTIATPAIATLGDLFIAWTGTDPGHHLNIMRSNNLKIFTNKVTFPETSDSGPGLAVFKNILYMAWRGTGNNFLNVAQIINGQEQNKVTIQTETTVAGPALAADSQFLYIAWTGTDNPHHLNVMRSVDGKNFTNKVTLNETSDFAPALTTESDELYLGWTGVGNDFLNRIVSTDHGLSFAGKITDQANTSLAGPALSVNLVGWTGTDPDHHLNIIGGV